MSCNYFDVDVNIVNDVLALTKTSQSNKTVENKDVKSDALAEKTSSEPLRVQKKNELRQAYMLTRYNRFINTLKVKGLAQAINEVNSTETKATKKYINKKFREEFNMLVDLF